MRGSVNSSSRAVRLALVAGAAASFCSAASAQQTIKVVFSNMAGHPTAAVPGLGGTEFKAGTATQFDRPYCSPDGKRWIFTALANLPTTEDECVIIGGGTSSAGAQLVAREGTATPFDAARTWGLFAQSCRINSSGQLVFQNDISGATTDDVMIVKYNGTTFDSVAIREGQSATPFGWPAGTLFGVTIQSAMITEGGDVGGMVSVTGGGTTTDTDSGVVLGSALLAQEGTTFLSSGFRWDTFDTTSFSIDANGTVLAGTGDDDNPTTTLDKVGTVNTSVVVSEGVPIPGLTTNVTTGGAADVFVGPTGHWIARGSSTNTDEDWVVVDGSLVAAGLHASLQDITPANPSGELFDDTTFAALFFSMAVNGKCDYIVGGVTNAADLNANAVMVLNGRRVVVRENDPVDMNDNGLDDDDAYVAVFNNDDCFLTNDMKLGFFADLRNAAGTSLGQAFLMKDLCLGDFNNDAFPDAIDYDQFISAWLGLNCTADMNGDGFVDAIDYDIFIAAWLSPC